MCGTLTNQARREEWVSCVVLICFTLCIPTSALPARPLPVVSGKPHGAKSYKLPSAIRIYYCKTTSLGRKNFNNIEMIFFRHFQQFQLLTCEGYNIPVAKQQSVTFLFPKVCDIILVELHVGGAA